MRFRSSKIGKKAARWLAGKYLWIYIPYQVLDFVAGKIGWLGVFTSPEDFQTAIERGPQWFSSMMEVMGPYIVSGVNLLLVAASYAFSKSALAFALVVFLLLLVVDVDSVLRRVSFWRFRARSVVTGTVWISETDAAQILRESEWGKLHSPYVSYTTSIFDDLSKSIVASATKTTVQHGISDKDKAMLRFKIYTRKILESFASDNPSETRVVDAKREYSEGAVRDLVERLLDGDIRSEFGNIPSTQL